MLPLLRLKGNMVLFYRLKWNRIPIPLNIPALKYHYFGYIYGLIKLIINEKKSALVLHIFYHFYFIS